MSDDDRSGLPESAQRPETASDPFAGLFDTRVAVPPGPLLEAPRAAVDVPARMDAPPVLGLERHVQVASARTGVFEWLSLVLAVIAPPVGVLAAIAVIVTGIRLNGFAATVAKIALALGIILSLVLGVTLSIVADAETKQAAHDAIVASSARYCAELRSDPGLLSSADYAFPASADTVTHSLAALQKYSDYWNGLVAVAPTGIRQGTRSVAHAVADILSSAQASRVFDDSSNAAQMEPVVATSGINAWVSQYCN